MAESSVIRLRGVRQHNLKRIDLDIPLNRLIAVSGVSGSGKSSLALHTLYAEGQRRYVETFSPYARQFLERMDPPQADLIDGIPPSIAIESGTVVRSSRSTVGTITEINDYLKLLFARLAVPHCPGCGQPVVRDTPESIYEKLQTLPSASRILITFPWYATDALAEPGLKNAGNADCDRAVTCSGGNLRHALMSQGFLRIFQEGRTVDLETLEEDTLRRLAKDGVLVVVDRLSWGRASSERVRDSLATAFDRGRQRLAVVVLPDQVRWFSNDLSCAACHPAPTIPEPVPNLFSFNSPLGACPQCRGFGRTIGVDLDLVIPDKRLSLKDGAIRPWSLDRSEFGDLMEFCRKERIPVDVPFQDLDEGARAKIINGTADYYGIKGFFEWLETKTYKMHVRVFLSRYRAYTTCRSCGGSRYQPGTLLYRVHGRTLAQINESSVRENMDFFDASWPELPGDPAAALLVNEIRTRLRFLHEVGLDYLTLNRQSRTLSGGEVQRVHLTRALGSALVNVLYVLDEPSVGLHARDQQRLMKQLRRLVDMGNTAVVVEHDPEMIRMCDEVIDLGPGGGEKGGAVLYQGPPEGLSLCAQSLTGAYLGGGGSLPTPNPVRSSLPERAIVIRGARENNLKNITVSIPLGLLVGVSGVSGSGKSTLVKKTLHAHWLRHRGIATETPGRCDGIEGFSYLEDMVLVDQQPIGRTPRANLLSYTQALGPIRELFARSPQAIDRGYSTGTFSFNQPGGRCEVCRGEGFERVEMQFLADVAIRCSQCEGRRFKDEVLDVRVRGLSIADVLECTAQELLDRFGDVRGLAESLEGIVAIGLDYLRVGQPLSTLSGGEAQRLKLLRYLNSGNGRSRLFILDEPTTGLHPHDLGKLVKVLRKLVDFGNTVVVVEHNLDLLKVCDWIIDLGPEGGDGGGEVVVAGPVEEVADCRHSHTGNHLKEKLSGTPKAHPKLPPIAAGLPTQSKPMEIVVRGARHHNLNIPELHLPLNKMVVMTGLSGSGKSTLAFDILFAEGQRRYLECLSSYVRQYFRILDRPDVDQVRGLPPAVAVEQRTSRWGRKSTVGTITEIHHFLRLLYAKLGRQACPHCGKELEALTSDEIVARVQEEVQKKGPVRLLAPLVRARKGIYRELFQRLKRLGFDTVYVDGEWLPLEPIPDLDRHREHDIGVLVARLGATGPRSDLSQAVQRALSLGSGSLQLEGEGTRIFSERLYCQPCDQGFPPLDPRLFSFNSRQGACPHCEGTGSVRRLQLERVLGPPEVPLKDGLMRFLRSPGWPESLRPSMKRLLRFWTEQLGVKPDQSFHELDEDLQRAMLNGKAGASAGLAGILEPLAEEDPPGILLPFMDEQPCPECLGQRLNPQARAVRFRGLSIAELAELSITDFQKTWRTFRGEEREQIILDPIGREIAVRTGFLIDVGLGYLALNRSGETLSGGEAQRIRLASQLGSNLRGVCYVLDEPTIGLHPVDNHRLLKSLRRLQRKGNTILVMEHDAETMRRADMLLELGPGAGAEGGRVVAMGLFKTLCGDPETLTGRWFGRTFENLLEVSREANPGAYGWLEIFGARVRNLKNVNVRLPLGMVTVVTGVSGAGKSTLVYEVIGRMVKERIGRSYRGVWDVVDRLAGFETIERVMEVDHSPIGRTPRSIPATYVGIWDEIRKLFSSLPEARVRGLSPGKFSFNVKGGRCEECMGQGEVKVAMSFLPNVSVPCESCGGRRFGEEILSVRFRGKNIADVLAMTVAEACGLFVSLPKILKPLEVLSSLGLGYLRLGQPSPTLSGGEAQRIKLASELGGRPNHTLYLLDEPTTGLHRADVKRLVEVLRTLTARGSTVIAVEHNTDFIWASDYVIDLGPGSGDRGGRVVAAGTPAELIGQGKHSVTARVLTRYHEAEQTPCERG